MSLALVIDMAVATYRVHLPNGFFLNWNMVPGRGHGIEFNVVLLGALIALMLTGPGRSQWTSRAASRARRGRAAARGPAGLT